MIDTIYGVLYFSYKGLLISRASQLGITNYELRLTVHCSLLIAHSLQLSTFSLFTYSPLHVFLPLV